MAVRKFLLTLVIAVFVFAVFCGIGWLLHSAGWFWIVLIIGFSMAGIVVEAWRELRIEQRKKRELR